MVAHSTENMKTPNLIKIWVFMLRLSWLRLKARLGFCDFYKLYYRIVDLETEYEAYICQFPEFLKEYCQ